MLKQLRFKNWRSLRDVTIDLAPLTVFIGANSSGKTNIVDTLLFWRDGFYQGGIESAVYQRGGRQKIQTLRSHGNVELGFTLEIPSIGYFDDDISIAFAPRKASFEVNRTLTLNDKEEISREIISVPQSNLDNAQINGGENWRRKITLGNNIRDNIRDRMQILQEGFSPLTRIPLHGTRDNYRLNQTGDNLPSVLSFMQGFQPELVRELNRDLHWLLNHTNKIDIEQDENETRLLVKEKQTLAPTISLGTQRILAMLTAHYGLELQPTLGFSHYTEPDEIPLQQLTGIIVIEEPDTALNPGVLQKFVELLRGYVENPDGTRPRQIILTTHNPTFLNYFHPEEVRVVERDENGYSTVHSIPDHIHDIWLKDGEYGLGEVWLTNLFGGTNA